MGNGYRAHVGRGLKSKGHRAEGGSFSKEGGTLESPGAPKRYEDTVCAVSCRGGHWRPVSEVFSRSLPHGKGEMEHIRRGCVDHRAVSFRPRAKHKHRTRPHTLRRECRV